MIRKRRCEHPPIFQFQCPLPKLTHSHSHPYTSVSLPFPPPKPRFHLLLQDRVPLSSYFPYPGFEIRRLRCLRRRSGPVLAVTLFPFTLSLTPINPSIFSPQKMAVHNLTVEPYPAYLDGHPTTRPTNTTPWLPAPHLLQKIRVCSANNPHPSSGPTYIPTQHPFGAFSQQSGNQIGRQRLKTVPIVFTCEFV